MEPNKEHIELLISRVLLGEATPEERLELDRWRSATEENEQQFEAYQKSLGHATNHLIGDSESETVIDIDQEWAHFQGRLQEHQESKQIPAIPLWSNTWIRVAASIILIAVIGFTLIQFIGTSDDITYYAEESGSVVTLPDGSTVVLNATTELTYPKTFNENAPRRVQLSGEAFFEVQHDKSSPFIVQMEVASVEVLGTSFNIEAYEDKQDIQVVVATGKVKLTSNKENNSVVLQKGDRGTYLKDNNQVIQEMNTDVNYLAWKTGQLVFEDVSLDLVVQTLNKLYDTNIIISAASAENCRVTVSFDQQSLEATLAVLEATLGLTYTRQGDLIEIVETGC